MSPWHSTCSQVLQNVDKWSVHKEIIPILRVTYPPCADTYTLCKGYLVDVITYTSALLPPRSWLHYGKRTMGQNAGSIERLADDQRMLSSIRHEELPTEGVGGKEQGMN